MEIGGNTLYIVIAVSSFLCGAFGSYISLTNNITKKTQVIEERIMDYCKIKFATVDGLHSIDTRLAAIEADCKNIMQTINSLRKGA